MRLTLSQKVFFIAFFVLVLVSVLHLARTTGFYTREAEKLIVNDNITLARMISKEIEAGYYSHQWPFEMLHDITNDFRGALFWRVIAPDGTVHLANDVSLCGRSSGLKPGTVRALQVRDEVSRATGRPIKAIVNPLEIRENGVPWLFEMGISLEPVASMKHHVFFADIVVVIISVLLASLLTLFYISRVITRPVRELIGGIEKVSRGDFGHRIHIAGKDEFGELAQAFNRMVADLQQANERIRDYTLTLEQKVAERTRELTQSQEKLLQSRKLAAVGQLAGGLAHELNNPLGVILGFTQCLLKEFKEGTRQHLPLNSIEREAVRCKKLVADLLTFSVISKAEKEDADINALVEDVVAPIEAQAKLNNVSIERRYSVELPKAAVNRNQFQQVIMNLCENALDAMPRGGRILVSTRSLVKAAAKGGRDQEAPDIIEIQVADTGYGMTEEVKKHLFEPFFTTKEVGKGTGLGLSLCYEVVKKHDGDIEVCSEVGKGTCFTLRLPAA